MSVGPSLDHPAEVELGIADGAHLPIDDRGQPGRRAVLEHHVGKLVVAVHQARDVVDGPVGPQPRRGDVEPGQLALLDPLEERRPPVHLPIVETVGTPEVLEPPCPPVHVAEEGDPLDQLVREALPGLEVLVEGGRPTVGVHRRPSVHEAHQVKGTAEDRLVRAHGDGRGVGHVGSLERLDDPPLSEDALVAALRGRGWWDPDGTVQLSPADLVDLVLRPARDVGLGDLLTLPRQSGLVHPPAEAVEVDH